MLAAGATITAITMATVITTATTAVITATALCQRDVARRQEQQNEGERFHKPYHRNLLKP